MFRSWIYKNETGFPLNVAGYHFGVAQELRSCIVINRFTEAVDKRLLSLREIEGEEILSENVLGEDSGKKTEAEPVTLSAVAVAENAGKIEEALASGEVAETVKKNGKKKGKHDVERENGD